MCNRVRNLRIGKYAPVIHGMIFHQQPFHTLEYHESYFDFHCTCN